MKKKTTIALLLLCIASLSLVAAFPESSYLIRLTVRNNTQQNVYVKMEAPSTFYYLTIKPARTSTFTIKPKVYKTTLWGCGTKQTIRQLSVKTNYRIIFPICNARPRASEGNVLRVRYPTVK